MTSRIAFVAAILLSAGVARAASTSSVPAGEEKVLETGAPFSEPAVACDMSSKALTAALLQVAAEDRGKVEAASCASNVTWPTTVDASYRR
jgi:hypothetical protein